MKIKVYSLTQVQDASPVTTVHATEWELLKHQRWLIRHHIQRNKDYPELKAECAELRTLIKKGAISQAWDRFTAGPICPPELTFGTPTIPSPSTPKLP